MGRWWLSPQSVLALWPDWFAPQQPDWPAQTQLMGFPLYDNSTQSSSDIAEEEAVLRRVLYGDHTQNDNAAKPPVLFTLDHSRCTILNFSSKPVLRVRCCNDAASFCWGSNRTGPKDLPSHMAYLDRYVPLSHLLPGVAAIVHHGGIGTASMAFAAGVPQVITPLAHDHFDNSRRIVGLGVARELRAKKVRADTLARALNELLSSSSVQVSCERVKAWCKIIKRWSAPAMCWKNWPAKH
jgi:rhamnosyltransferase subunit B